MGKLIFGLIIGLIALYGGSYFLHEIPMSHWANFPVFMTTVFAGFAAAILVASGLTEIEHG